MKLDFFKSSVKIILLGAVFLGCAHADPSINDIIDLLNLENPKDVPNVGIPGAMPPPPTIGIPKLLGRGMGGNSFPKIRETINQHATQKEKNSLLSILDLLDAMYAFEGGHFKVGKYEVPYKNSEDIKYVKRMVEGEKESGRKLGMSKEINELISDQSSILKTIQSMSIDMFSDDLKVEDIKPILTAPRDLNFLKMLGDEKLSKSISDAIGKIVEKIVSRYSSYKTAVFDYNQANKAFEELRPWGLSKSQISLFNRYPELEKVVVNYQKKDCEKFLINYFGKLNQLNQQDTDELKSIEGRLKVAKAEVRRLTDEMDAREVQLNVEKVPNPLDSVGSDFVKALKYRNTPEGAQAIKKYKENKANRKLVLDGDPEYQRLVKDKSAQNAIIADEEDKKRALLSKEFKMADVLREIKEGVKSLPLGFSNDTSLFINRLKAEVQGYEAVPVNTSANTDVKPSSSTAKPEVKEVKKTSRVKSPLEKSMVVTNAEQEAVKEEAPKFAPPKKGKKGSEMDQLNQEIKSLRKENTVLLQQLREATNKQRAAFMQQENNFKQKMEEALKSYKSDNYALNKELEALEKDLALKEGRIKELEKQLEGLRKELGTGNAGALKNNENNNNNAALEALAQINNTLKDRNSALERDLAAERAKNANSEQNTKEVVTERIVRRGGTTTVIEDTERIDALTKDIEARNAQLSQQQSALDSKDAQIRQLQQRNQQLQNQLNAQEDNKQSPASNEPSVNEENLKLQRQQWEEMVAELENKQNELKDREAEVSKREQTVNQMQQTTNNVLQMLNRQNNEASKNVNADQSEATKNGNVEMMPQVQLGA